MKSMSFSIQKNVGLLAASVAALAFLHLSLIARKKRKEQNAQYPPMAPAGISQTILQLSSTDYTFFMLRMAKKTNTFTFRLNLPIFGVPMVVAVGDHETQRAILTHKLTERPHELYNSFNYITGGVAPIFTSNGEYWHRRRKMLAPGFDKIHVKRMNDLVMDGIDSWINNTLKPMAKKGDAFDMSEEMLRVILSALCETAFEYQITVEDYEEYMEDLDMCLKEFLFKSTLNPFRVLAGRLLPARRRAHDAASRLMCFAEKIMENYRHLDTATEGTLIHIIMNSNVYKNDAERQAEIVFLLLAGHDTTAYTISWTLYELAKQPKYIENIRQKLKGLPVNEWQKSEQVKNVVRESMRMHPVAAAGSIRSIGVDIQTKEGYVIPKGSYVFLALILLFHNSSIYEEPEKFLPERWENASKEMMDSFLPYSLGKQNCLGQALARIEIHSVVARICSEFDLSVAEEGEAKYFISLKLKGAKIIAHQR